MLIIRKEKNTCPDLNEPFLQNKRINQNAYASDVCTCLEWLLFIPFRIGGRGGSYNSLMKRKVRWITPCSSSIHIRLQYWTRMKGWNERVICKIWKHLSSIYVYVCVRARTCILYRYKEPGISKQRTASRELRKINLKSALSRWRVIYFRNVQVVEVRKTDGRRKVL